MAEAVRILKPGGLLFAAGINRLAYLSDFFRLFPHVVLERKAFHEQFCSTAIWIRRTRRPSASRTCPHMRSFARCLRPSVESFSTAWQPTLNDLPPAEAEAWLDLIEQTGQTAEGWASPIISCMWEGRGRSKMKASA